MEYKSLMNQSEFAEHLGKTKQYVSKLSKEDKLVKVGKLVDVDKTINKLKKMSDPAKAKNPILSNKKDSSTNLTEDEVLAIIDDSLEDEEDFNKSKARKEYFLSKSAELNYLKEKNKLIEVYLVEKQYFAVSRQLRDKIFNLTYRLSSQLTILSDATIITNLLNKEFRNVFKEIDDSLAEQLKEIEEEDNEE